MRGLSVSLSLVLVGLVPACTCGGSGVGDSLDGGSDGAVLFDAMGDATAFDASAFDATAFDAMPPVPACNDCHGDETGNAPPFDTQGNTNTALRGIGAHRSHLRMDTGWHRDVVCSDCHLVPAAVGDTGHTDSALPAELLWGPVAQSDGATPSFDGASTTCAGVYCHGETLSGGSNTTPDWTKVASGETACGTCHGVPPMAPHPANSDCSTCHPTVDASLTFLLPQRHVDGVVDLAPGTLSCTACHGAGSSAAPPRDTRGNLETSARGVGAHRSHLGPSSWHEEIGCDGCHLVPAALSDLGHMDTGLPAELTWGTRAISDGAAPSFDGASTTCSGVYCHGATLLAGGSNTTPNWTIVGVPGSAQAECGTCHGLPPLAPHPSDGDCASCHPTIAADFSFPDPSRHIDGVVDVVSLDCTSCHGDVAAGDPAPPRDTGGNTATSARGVGAHQSHLGPSAWRAAIACTDCHLRPNATSDPGHNDTSLPAELTWGSRATADGATPSLNGATMSCAGVYCHGATLISGGSNTAPTWTSVGSGEAACGTCHGLPPTGAGHPADSDCSACHATVAADDSSFVFPERHVDGVVDLTVLDCTSCHGDVASGDPAPPRDTSGNTLTTARGVGAHQSHLGASSWRAAIDCSECHIRPASVSSPGHRDSALPAELSFGGRATADGATPAFQGATTTCEGVYCHGATLQPGGSNTTPNWTRVGSGEAACGSCHSLPPGGTHTSLSACEDCHDPVAGAGLVILSANLHVDGTVQVHDYHTAGWSAAARHGATVNNTGYSSCQSCHGADLDGGAAGVSCDSCHSGWKTDCNFCHGGTDNNTGAPPEGIDGETSRTALAVGAHSEHVSTTAMHLAWGCDKCHTVPSSATTPGHIDGDGRAELGFGALNPSATYSASSGTCADLYCHGNGTTTLGSAVWSANPTLDCGSCHADFFSPAESDLSAMSGKHKKHVISRGIGCEDCHGANVDATGAILQLDRHVDGVVDVDLPDYTPSGCNDRGSCSPSCHNTKCWN